MGLPRGVWICRAGAGRGVATHGLVHHFGIASQDILAVPQPTFRDLRLGKGEDVALLQIAVPPAQPIQALLLLLKLTESELLLPDLVVDLCLVLAAVGLELVPFIQTSRHERIANQCQPCLTSRRRLDDSESATTRVSEFFGTLQRGLERRRIRDRPGTLGDRGRATLSQLPPDRDPMPGRFGGQLHQNQKPGHVIRHEEECNIRYMATHTGHALLDRTFFIGLILKGLDGLVELIGGIALLLVTPGQIDRAVHALTRHELHEDPGDFIANTLVHYADTLNVSTTLFGAIYLLAHGTVKVFLVVAVLRGQLWAYPWLIGFLIVFIGYQSYELIAHPSWGLAGLTAFDIFIVILTIREYRLRRQDRERAS